jgi:hypothetical protein
VPHPCQFNQPGVFTVTGTYAGTVPQTGNITVDVVDYAFPNNPDCWVGWERYWDLTNIPPEVALQADSRLVFELTTALPDNGQRIGLLTAANEVRKVVARLGTGGPILDSTRVNGFEFWTPSDTYTRVLRADTNGNQIVEAMLVLSPVPSDLLVQMDVNAGGIMFSDGSISKALSASDFDSLGRCKVQFLRPAGARTSVCHSIKVLQGADLVGWQR